MRLDGPSQKRFSMRWTQMRAEDGDELLSVEGDDMRVMGID